MYVRMFMCEFICKFIKHLSTFHLFALRLVSSFTFCNLVKIDVKQNKFKFK